MEEQSSFEQAAHNLQRLVSRCISNDLLTVCMNLIYTINTKHTFHLGLPLYSFIII